MASSKLLTLFSPIRSSSLSAPALSAVDVADVGEHFLLHQLIDHRFAEALDVHRAARSEMLDPAAHLRRALAVHATDRDLPFVLHHRTAAFRAMLRHPEFLLAARPQIRPDS